jgi:tetratricopeptide (TPR) repeat protein
MTEETLFHKALAKPARERAAFLDAACAGQPELRAAVETLLAAHAADNLLELLPVALGRTVTAESNSARPATTSEPQPYPAGPAPLVTTTDYRPPVEPGLVIAGRYTLVEKLGEGGMGEVWVAKQTEPVKRKVALKLIKAGMDSQAVLARFEQERQALALMDHPNIARVLDGGLTPDGRPFFVMELVNGLPLTQFCDEARLTPRERLELFIPICQAVQHAHHKGIVHRDLKPGNILVTRSDGQPVPKVIDFGVAKATAGKLTEETLSTQFGAVVGTLEYMAPEQAGYFGEDIDTRADIYSLGVILYELLTGLRPLDGKRLKQAALTEAIRIIREEEPSRPSTRLSTCESLSTLAAVRQTEPRKLLALLRGELDWIVLRCLEKDRNRRYETANGLARDLQRYLADEPVEARPPSARYRLGKFLRRNKGPVIAAALLLLALVGGIAGTTHGMLDAEQRRVEADEAHDREAQRAIGEQQAKELEAAQRAKAENARDRARQALDAMTSAVTGDSLTTQKDISPEQKRFLTEVLTYYQEFAGEKAEDERSQYRTVSAAQRVGMIEYRLGRKHEAAAACRRARDGFAKLAADFPTVPEYREHLATSEGNLGLLARALGRPTEAERHERTALALLEKLAADFPTEPEHRRNLALACNNLGNLLKDLGRTREAVEQHRRALAFFAKLAADFPGVPRSGLDLAFGHHNLGLLLNSRGEHREAEEQLRQALTICTRLLATFADVPEHREALAKVHSSLGFMLNGQGRQPEAEKQYRKAVRMYARLAADFPAVPDYRSSLALSHNNLGALLAQRKRPSEAEVEHRQALAIFAKLAADFPAVPGHRQGLALSHYHLGTPLAELGKQAEAEQQHRLALATQEKLAAEFPALPELHKELGASHTILGILLEQQGKLRQAEEQHHKAVAALERLAAEFPDMPEHRRDLGGSYCNLAHLVRKRGEPGTSLEWYGKAIRTLTQVCEQDRRSPEAWQFLRNSYLGRVQANYALRDYAAMVKDLDRAIDLSPKPEQRDLRVTRVLARLKAGQVAEAVAEVNELAEGPSWPAVTLYDFARAYARASSKNSEHKQEYADRAMGLLRQAVGAGYRDTARLRADPDLERLRGREDFQELIRQLETRGSGNAEKQR